MAWSEAQLFCRIHPNENPQPGVCPSCLRERLTRISAGKSSSSMYSFNVSSSYSTSPAVYYCYSSGSSSGAGSPPTTRHRHQRVASDIMDSIYLAMSGNGAGLKKSRSIAFTSRSSHGVVRDGSVSCVSSRKKKGGFWHKLLVRSGGKKAAKF